MTYDPLQAANDIEHMCRWKRNGDEGNPRFFLIFFCSLAIVRRSLNIVQVLSRLIVFFISLVREREHHAQLNEETSCKQSAVEHPLFS